MLIKGLVFFTRAKAFFVGNGCGRGRKMFHGLCIWPVDFPHELLFPQAFVWKALSFAHSLSFLDGWTNGFERLKHLWLIMCPIPIVGLLLLSFLYEHVPSSAVFPQLWWTTIPKDFLRLSTLQIKAPLPNGIPDCWHLCHALSASKLYMVALKKGRDYWTVPYIRPRKSARTCFNCTALLFCLFWASYNSALKRFEDKEHARLARNMFQRIVNPRSRMLELRRDVYQ